jgi:hypothetical protein
MDKACKTYVKEMRNTYKILFRKLEGSEYLGDLGVNWRTILQWLLRNTV